MAIRRLICQKLDVDTQLGQRSSEVSAVLIKRRKAMQSHHHNCKISDQCRRLFPFVPVSKHSIKAGLGNTQTEPVERKILVSMAFQAFEPLYFTVGPLNAYSKLERYLHGFKVCAKGLQ